LSDMGVGPIIVMGVSGCGKTTVGEALARDFGVPYIEGDALHPKANVEKMRGGTPLNDDDRWPWLEEIGRQLKAQTAMAGGAIATCSSLKQSYRQRLRHTAGGNLRFVFLNCSRPVLESRMAARKNHFMPPSLLASQLAALEDPTGEAGVEAVNGDAEPKAIVDEAIFKLSAANAIDSQANS
jgi:gluconokinase